MKIKLLITFIFLGIIPCFVVNGIAQKFNFKIYSVNEGLPHSQVHDIEQTADGFMWFGTLGGGITRFDGGSFTTYTREDGLNSDLVEVVYEDSKERLWVTTEAGGILQLVGDRFVNPFPEDSLEKFTILNIYELRDGDLLFATYEKGFIRYDGKNLKMISKEDGLLDNTVWDFWEQENGQILIATHAGLSIYDGSGFRNYTQSDGLSGEKIFKIEKDDSGKYWFATSNGVTVWDGNSFKRIRQINGRDLNYIYDIIKADDGKIWIGTEYIGVFVYDGKEYQHISKKNGLSSNNIYSFFKDHNGQMWVATDENGVNFYKGDAFRFYGRESNLFSEEILSICQAKDKTIWLGTYEGIFSYDGDTFEKAKEFSEFTISQEVWDIAELPNGNLLFLMPDNSIYEYDGTTFSNYTAEHGLQKWYTYELFVDAGILWIGTDEGLIRVGESGYRKYTMEEDGLASNVIRNLYKGSEGYLWIATYNGLSRYDGSEFQNIGLKDGLSHSEINHIAEDKSGNLWLGTGGGVSLLKRSAETDDFQIMNFGREEGMKLLDTQFLWFDPQGYLWQGTNAGLNRLDVSRFWETETMNIVHYPLSEIGLGIETNHKAIAPAEDGKLLIGTMNGMVKLDPSEIISSDKAPEVYLSYILVNSNPVEWNKFSDGLSYKLGIPQFPEVNFPYSSQSITFSFAGLDFNNSKNIKYRYKIEGFEDDWMPVTKSRSATYTNISPGEYTFKVEASSVGGIWSSEPATFRFRVDHPFWMSYWFYTLVTVTFLGIGYLYNRFRLQALEKNKLKQLVDEQTEDLQKALAEKEVLIKEIHHRVKNNLAVISGLLELQMEYSDDDFAVRTLTESQRRVQSIAMIHEKLYQNENLSEIDFQKYIEELLAIISYSFDFENKEIDLKHTVDDISLSIDQAIPCGLILNELVSNAYEHAFKNQKEGSVCIRFLKDGDKILFSVSDSGGGLPKDIDSKKQDSLGITLVETLASQLHGELNVESSAEGSTFSITFVKKEFSKKVFA